MIPGMLSDTFDIDITKVILSGMPDDLTILESGIFLGSWCIFVNDLKSNSKFYGVENLDFIKSKLELGWYSEFSDEFKKELAVGKLDKLLSNQTTTELEDFVKLRSIELTSKDIDISISSHIDMNKKFNLIHHDCAWDIETNEMFMDQYIKVMDDGAILIVDNYGPEQPLRTAVVGKYLLDKKFYPIGFGKHKAYLAKDKTTASHYTKLVLRHAFDFNLYKKPDSFFGKYVFSILPTEKYSHG